MCDDPMDLAKSTQQEARLAANTRSLAAGRKKHLDLLFVLFHPLVKVKHRQDLMIVMGLSTPIEDATEGKGG